MSVYVRLCPPMSVYVRLCPPMSVYVRLCPSMSAYVLSFLDSMRQADIDGRDTPPPVKCIAIVKGTDDKRLHDDLHLGFREEGFHFCNVSHLVAVCSFKFLYLRTKRQCGIQCKAKVFSNIDKSNADRRFKEDTTNFQLRQNTF